MDAADLQITADLVEWSPGHLVATGHVTVEYGPTHLVAEEATWDGARVVKLKSARLTRPEGELTFTAGEVWLDEGGDFFTVNARIGDAGLRAARVTVGDTWTFQDAVVEPCHCADGKPAALDFSARGGELVPNEYVVIRGGAVRIFTVPILPVPLWREPLNPDRFRLMLPEVGYGDPGWSASLAGTGATHGWRFTGGPAWRQDRGVRGELAVDGPVDAQGQLGWDFETETVRGAGTTRAGWADPLRVAWDLTGQTDPTYADDYGLSWVRRGVDWRDSRAVVGWKGAQLAGWIGDDGSDGQLLRARYRPVFGRGTWVAPWAGLALDGPTTLTGYGLGGVDAGTSATWGPAHAEAQLASQIRTSGGWDAAATARAELPLWTDLGKGRLRLWPGVTGEGSLAGALPAAAPTFAGAVGPGLRAQLVAGSVVASGQVDALYGATGWLPRGNLDLSSGPVSAWVSADRSVQGAGLTWSAPVSGSVGVVHADALFLAWGSVDAHLGRLLLGAGVAGDLDAVDWTGINAKVGYDDGCSLLALTGAISPDRLFPDLGLQLVLRK